MPNIAIGTTQGSVVPLAMFSINLSITDSPTKGVRIRDGETDLEDFDLGLESELEDVKN